MSRLVTLASLGLLLTVPAWAEDQKTPWEYSVSLYGYDVPTEDYLNPNLTVDHGMLHLEARYQYEAVDSGSVWAGANFSVGETWVYHATVMGGVVLGDVEGFAPGYRMSLGHTWFSISSEGEYLFDFHDHENNFFYCWNEMTGAPVHWFRLGLAAQRTRAYETGLSLQRGFTVGFNYKFFDAAAYVFNLDQDTPTYVASVRFTF